MGPERHQCVYIAQLPCSASSQDRRIKIIAQLVTESRLKRMACNRFRASFFVIMVRSCRSYGAPQALVHTEITNSIPIWQAKRRVGRAYGRAVVPPSEYDGMFLVTETALETY